MELQDRSVASATRRAGEWTSLGARWRLWLSGQWPSMRLPGRSSIAGRRPPERTGCRDRRPAGGSTASDGFTLTSTRVYPLDNRFDPGLGEAFEDRVHLVSGKGHPAVEPPRQHADEPVGSEDSSCLEAALVLDRAARLKVLDQRGGEHRAHPARRQLTAPRAKERSVEAPVLGLFHLLEQGLGSPENRSRRAGAWRRRHHLVDHR